MIHAYCLLSWKRKELPIAGSQGVPAARTANGVLFFISANEGNLISRLLWPFQGSARGRILHRVLESHRNMKETFYISFRCEGCKYI